MLPVLASSAASDHYVDIDVPLWVWGAFLVLVIVLLLIDLLVIHRDAHAVSTKEAAIESAAWIGISLLFGVVILWWQGGGAAGEYYAGYLIEKSLSIDNVFVWALIMGYFGVPDKYQFRVLFWGIFGALILRGLFIFGGVAVIERFDWVIYVFGVFLVYTGIKLLFSDDEEVHPDENPVLQVVNKVIPSTTEYDGQKLFTKKNAKRVATPLLAVIIVIETSDVVFAVDSIPAILAVSREQFIVFSSNAFAILGLRALYFLLADLRNRFRFLQQGIALVLAFVGVKMLVSELYHVPTYLSLVVIAAILAVAVVVSIVRPPADDEGGEQPDGDGHGEADDGAGRHEGDVDERTAADGSD